jgi:hypothetical protein
MMLVLAVNCRSPLPLAVWLLAVYWYCLLVLAVAGCWLFLRTATLPAFQKGRLATGTGRSLRVFNPHMINTHQHFLENNLDIGNIF